MLRRCAGIQQGDALQQFELEGFEVHRPKLNRREATNASEPPRRNERNGGATECKRTEEERR